MKKILVLYFTLFFIQNCISQGISIGEMSQNLSIIPLTIKKDFNSIDSTFVYAIVLYFHCTINDVISSFFNESWRENKHS